jgi:hypothetical protein
MASRVGTVAVLVVTMVLASALHLHDPAHGRRTCGRRGAGWTSTCLPRRRS